MILRKAFIQYIPGHKNSKGESAPWVIRDHKTKKILQSYKSKAEAEAGLKRMRYFKHKSFLNPLIDDLSSFVGISINLIDPEFLEKTDDNFLVKAHLVSHLVYKQTGNPIVVKAHNAVIKEAQKRNLFLGQDITPIQINKWASGLDTRWYIRKLPEENKWVIKNNNGYIYGEYLSKEDAVKALNNIIQARSHLYTPFLVAVDCIKENFKEDWSKFKLTASLNYKIPEDVIEEARTYILINADDNNVEVSVEEANELVDMFKEVNDLIKQVDLEIDVLLDAVERDEKDYDLDTITEFIKKSSKEEIPAERDFSMAEDEKTFFGDERDKQYIYKGPKWRLKNPPDYRIDRYYDIKPKQVIGPGRDVVEKYDIFNYSETAGWGKAFKPSQTPIGVGNPIVEEIGLGTDMYRVGMNRSELNYVKDIILQFSKKVALLLASHIRFSYALNLLLNLYDYDPKIFVTKTEQLTKEALIKIFYDYYFNKEEAQAEGIKALLKDATKKAVDEVPVLSPEEIFLNIFSNYTQKGELSSLTDTQIIYSIIKTLKNNYSSKVPKIFSILKFTFVSYDEFTNDLVVLMNRAGASKLDASLKQVLVNFNPQKPPTLNELLGFEQKVIDDPNELIQLFSKEKGTYNLQEFKKWLGEISDKYTIPKETVQRAIKSLVEFLPTYSKTLYIKLYNSLVSLRERVKQINEIINTIRAKRARISHILQNLKKQLFDVESDVAVKFEEVPTSPVYADILSTVLRGLSGEAKKLLIDYAAADFVLKNLDISMKIILKEFKDLVTAAKKAGFPITL